MGTDALGVALASELTKQVIELVAHQVGAEGAFELLAEAPGRGAEMGTLVAAGMRAARHRKMAGGAVPHGAAHGCHAAASVSHGTLPEAVTIVVESLV